MNAKELEARLAVLEAENATLKAKAAKGNTVGFKVTDKGALSMYGLGRFPVTLYRSQWERVIAHVPEITKHIAGLPEKSPAVAAS